MPATRALLLLSLLAACAGSPEASAPGREPEPELLPSLTVDGLRVAVVAGEAGMFTLRMDVVGDPVGSLQGELRFDPAVWSVSEVVPVTGAFTVANTEDLSRGRLRFAVFSSEALAAGDLLRFRAEASGPLSRAGVELRLEAAGTVDGRALPAGALQPTRGVYRAAR